MNLSRGEYITFVDADDAITKTALEELYTLAKKFNADVVACDNYYSMDENGKTTFQPVTYINDFKIRREKISLRAECDLFLSPSGKGVSVLRRRL